MAKKLIGISSLFFIVIICLAFEGNNNQVQKSDGGPPYNTNAPGEKTCSGAEGANSCHSGGIPDNSGPGTPSILFSGGTTYVPGQTYTITPKIFHPTRSRFGFQIVSLKDSNNAFIGTITLIDTNVTRQQQPTWGSYQDRIFVMHRLAGSYATSPNTSTWTYKWTAPSYNAGNISFYACFNAVNNNNVNDPGDETYYKKITINPSAIGIAPVNESKIDFSFYPNPANEMITVEFNDLKAQGVTISVMDLQGKIVKKIVAQNTKEVIETRELENDVYSIVVTENQKILSVKKVVIQH